MKYIFAIILLFGTVLPITFIQAENATKSAKYLSTSSINKPTASITHKKEIKKVTAKINKKPKAKAHHKKKFTTYKADKFYGGFVRAGDKPNKYRAATSTPVISTTTNNVI